MSTIQSRAFSPRMLVRRVRATGRNLTGNNLAIIAVGSYLSFLVSALLAGVIAAICGYASDSPARIAGALGAIAAAGAAVIWIGGQEEQREEREAAELRQPDSQAARITHAQSLLREAGDRIARTLTETTATIQKAVDSTTGIVDALQDELRTNRAAIDTLIDQARAAEQAAAEADARAAIGQEGAKAVDAQLSRSVTTLLTTSERVSAARAAQSGRARGAPKGRDGAVEAVRTLMVAKRSAHSERTQAINQARALIVTGPEDLRARFAAHATADLVAELASLRPRPGAVVGYHTRIALRELGRRAEFLDGQIVCLDALIVPLVTGHAPGLMALHGVGSDTAALLLVAAGDHPERLRSEAAWAHLCAAAPIPASSGKTIRHRLNPAGDRQASHALWRIVITRMSSHPPTRAYVERRTAEGLSKKEIMRCLKRYVAREVCRGRIYLANFELLGHLPSPVSPKAVRASNESARPLDVEGRAGRAGDQSVGDQKTHVGEKALAH